MISKVPNRARVPINIKIKPIKSFEPPALFSGCAVVKFSDIITPILRLKNIQLKALIETEIGESQVLHGEKN
jgi:hypothetical protein